MQFKKLVLQSLLWRGFYFLTVLILNILVSRHLEASGSGWLFYLSNIYAFIVLILGSGFEYGFGYFVSSKKIPSYKLANFSLLYVALLSIIAGSIFYTSFREEIVTSGHSLFTLIGYVSGNLLINFFAALFYSRRNFFLPNLIFSLCNLTLILMMLFPGLMYIPGRFNIEFPSIYFGNFLVQGLVIAGCYYVKHISTLEMMLPTAKDLKMLFRYALSIFILNTALFLAFRIDSWIIEYYCTPGELGNYIQVSKLVQVFLILPVILASAVFPVSAGSQTDNSLTGHIQALSRILTLLFITGCSFLVLTGNWLFPFIYGNSFSNMYSVFIFMIPGILSLNVLTMLNAYFAGKNLIRIHVTGALVSLFIIVSGDLLFIPRFGIQGAALVSSTGYMFNAIYALYFFTKLNHCDVSDFFVIRKSDFTGLTSLIMRR